VRTRTPAAVLAVALLLVGASSSQAATPPSFTDYAAPNGLGTDSGEPSIGVNWNTGRTMFQSGLQTLRVDFSTTPPTWTDVSHVLTSTTSLDPILFTDHSTGRTFVSQLAGGCSLMAFTDNDGASWTPNPIGCGLAAAADHQTVGGGPFAAGPLGPLTSYPHTVYYCAQAIVSAQCSLSQDGGLNFNPAVSIYNATQCGGLHGHEKSAPDGTAYVPNADCGGKAAAVISKNNGVTWTVSIPDSGTQDESDPSIGIGASGTVYEGYDGANGHPFVAVYHPATGTWSPSIDVGTAFGIQNAQFPAVVAGDDNRASFAFLGTPTGGDDQNCGFGGAWHLYVATTYDGGSTWTTVDATPNDPVQRGGIWMGGGSSPCRNLLDFMDSTIGQKGNVEVGFADGCTGSCVTGGTNNRSSLATIARQEAGTGLLSAFDAIAPPF
jgi:hypothetical protein